MFKSFLAIALVLSAHYKSFIVQAVPTPLQLLSTEKQCEFKTATSFITRSTKAKLFGNKKTNMEIKAEMTTLLQAVKPHPADRLLDADIFQPELYYRMGIYTAMTYCDSKESVQKISGLALNTTASGKLDLPLYTGNFSILSYQNQATKIVDSKKDSLYIVYRNDLQKSIILSWRGSVSIEDFIADADSSKVKQGNPLETPFVNQTSCPLNLPTTSSNDSFYIFDGFAKTLTKEIAGAMLADLQAARTAAPDYDIVITGHSLGGAKALLSSLWLSLYYRDSLPIKAVYAFEAPSTGSNSFNDYLAKCVGPNKIVRITSSNDIIPWGRVGAENQFSKSVKEIFAPDPTKPVWKSCLGPNDPQCSSSIPCSKKNWDNHSIIGGLRLMKSICSLATADQGWGADSILKTQSEKIANGFKKVGESLRKIHF